MRQSYSLTAEGMALLRAIEQARPPEQRIITDPYAAAFLRFPGLQWIARSRWLSRLLLGFFDKRAPGAVEFLTIRPRLVDELATELVAQGLEQIVILGAGFDTMSLRIREQLGSVTIYEVDHPATQAAKHKTIAQTHIRKKRMQISVNQLFQKNKLLTTLANPDQPRHHRRDFDSYEPRRTSESNSLLQICFSFDC